MINYLMKKLGLIPDLNPELEKFIKDGAKLVDVRTPNEFAFGSATGAINIPLSQVKNRIDEFKNPEGIVVFCRSGNRSGQAKNLLLANKISNVINGGTWKKVKKIQEGLTE